MTILKIKRSPATGGNAVPADGQLKGGELGFSYSSANLFIGAENDTGPAILLTSIKTVNSVAPVSGNITLTTSNVAEGSNLYYTQGRFDAAFGAKSIDSLSDVIISTPSSGQLLSYNGTNWVNVPPPTTGVSSVNGFTGVVTLTTDNVSEGTNKYFSNALADARIAAAVGTTVQGFDATLSALAGVTTAANKLIYATGSDTFTTTDLTSYARTLLATSSASAARTTLDAQQTLGFVPVSTAGSAMLSNADITFSGGGEILGLPATPSADDAAVSKAYVDAIAAGLTWKNAVRVATTANVNLASGLVNGAVLDSIPVATGDRVLVKSQTNAAENGIYIVAASGAASRSTDFDSVSPIDEINGAAVHVTVGTLNSNTNWTQISTVAVLGTDPITWSQFSGAGSGVSSITGTTNRLTASSPTGAVTLDISASYVGQASITTLGTITTGTWNGSAIPVANGGTGATSAPAALTSLGAYAASNPNGYTSNVGTVTSTSVVSANGFAGSVATSTATPAITLSTTVNGMVKGNGTAISAATSGTDYSAGTSALGTGILKSTTGTGALTIAIAADFPTLNQNTTGTAANVTGTVAIANGGTGQTSATAALNALLPSQTSNSGKFLTTDGTNASWTDTLDGGSF